MRRMNLFYSLLLAGFLATGYACLSDVPVFADELEENVTESVESVEITGDTISDSGTDEIVASVSSDVGEIVTVPEADAGEIVTAPEADAVENDDSSVTYDTESAESVTADNVAQEESDAGALTDETLAGAVETVVAGDQEADESGKGSFAWQHTHFDTQEMPVNYCLTVSISADSDGKLQATVLYKGDYPGETGPITNPYTLSYKIPSSWTEEQQEEFCEILESYANYVMSVVSSDSLVMDFAGIKYATTPDDSATPQLTDAEKFDNPTLVLKPHEIDTFDGIHCWAASAANTLWTSGWAKQATNPLTGKVFASEDEVMTYFSSCFTDAGYIDTYGINWFFNGIYTSIQQGAAVVANRTDVYEEENELNGTEQYGLLNNYDLQKVVNGEKLVETGSLTDEYMKDLEKIEKAGFTDKSYGLTLYTFHYDKATSSWGSASAHAVTLVGLLYDENEENLTDRYKAIMLADSDNDSYISNDGQLYKPENATDVTAQKASQTNSYTLYKLLHAKQNLLGESTEFWYLPGYMYNPDNLVVLVGYYSIKNCNEQTMRDYAVSANQTSQSESEKDGSQSESKKDGSSDSSTEDKAKSTGEEDATTVSVIDQMVKAARVEFQKNPDLNKKSFILRGASVNDKKYQWGTTYQLGKNWKYAFVANRALKLIGQITLDGKVLDPSEYTIIFYDDVCVILFSADFMQNLSAGQHIFTFSCEGFDEPTQMTVMVTE